MLRTTRLYLAIFFVLNFSIFCSAAIAESTEESMPRFEVTTLNKNEKVIPENLSNSPSVFVIGFTKGSRKQTLAWTQALELRYANGTPKIYGVAVLETVPKFVRGFVKKMIKGDIKKDNYDNFFVVTQQSEQWKSLVDFNNKNDAYIIAMMEDFSLAHKISGPVSEEKIDLIEKSLSLTDR